MNRSPWPDFFVIGAGKAGTTTLYEMLQRHPRLFLPDAKEPRYFSDPRFVASRLVLDRERYLDLYATAGPRQLRGDFSTSYFLCPDTPGRIRECNPDARFIVLLRDPVSRAYSDYLMLSRRDGLIEQDFVSELEDELERLDDGRVEWPFLVRSGLYYRSIRRYLDYFPAESLLVLHMQDLLATPRDVLRRIEDFLGIEAMPVDNELLQTHSNPFVEARSSVLRRLYTNGRLRRGLAGILPVAARRALKAFGARILYRRAEKPGMPDAAWPLLQPVFDEDLCKLRELLDVDVDRLRADWPSTGTAR